MKKLVSTWILLSSVLALVLSVAAFAQTADKSASSSESKGRPALRGARALGAFTLFDTNHDGVLSADEIRNASDALWKLDRNGDGRLTAVELRPEGPPPPREDRPPDEHEDDAPPR